VSVFFVINEDDQKKKGAINGDAYEALYRLA